MNQGFHSFALRAVVFSAAAIAGLAAAMPARADSLDSALADVYENNPALNAGRARLRATDEELAKAQSGYRPQIGLNADTGLQIQNSAVKPPTSFSPFGTVASQVASNAAAFKRYDGETNPGGLNVTVSQSLFDGFQTNNGIHAANANILAQREALRDIEQRTLLQAITTYMDVMRDAATVTLRQNNVKFLTGQVKATQERFAAGAATRTDLAQARAREADARASKEAAKANLRGSLANYQRLVGHVPARLTNPAGFERLLPSRIEDAISAAETRNPQVLQASFSEKASTYEIRRTLGQMLPQVTFQATHSERYNPSTVLYQQSIESAVVRVNVPIYQAGDLEARVRQAKQQRQGQIQEIVSARELARAQAISSFAQVQASRAQVAAVREQVKAANETVSGVREEQLAGQRTLLDVLNAEQELTAAEVSSANAHHDLVVAAYSLLATMGRLTAVDLDLGVKLYDVHKHYAEINGKWGGTVIEHDPNYAPRAQEWAPAVEEK